MNNLPKQKLVKLKKSFYLLSKLCCYLFYIQIIFSPWKAIATIANPPKETNKAEKISRRNGCASCHASNKKLVGPSYQDIAKEYTGKKNAQEIIIKSIQFGSKGKFGSSPMPSNRHISNEESQALATWILLGEANHE